VDKENVALGDCDGISPAEPEPSPVTTMHDVTSWTAEFPLTSVMGVRIIVHVSFIGPIVVWAIWVVVSVVGEVKLPA